LLQLGFTGDTERRLKGAPQAGVGFVHNTFRDGDTSWLIPIGAGADSALGDKPSVTGTLLLNFTDLDTGRGSGADVMPGFTIGVRFYVSVTGVVYWMLYRL
jgi:hypothetical protein